MQPDFARRATRLRVPHASRGHDGTMRGEPPAPSPAVQRPVLSSRAATQPLPTPPPPSAAAVAGVRLGHGSAAMGRNERRDGAHADARRLSRGRARSRAGSSPWPPRWSPSA
eukprot:4881382-Prymnesium_polylepis.1